MELLKLRLLDLHMYWYYIISLVHYAGKALNGPFISFQGCVLNSASVLEIVCCLQSDWLRACGTHSFSTTPLEEVCQMFPLLNLSVFFSFSIRQHFKIYWGSTKLLQFIKRHIKWIRYGLCPISITPSCICFHTGTWNNSYSVSTPQRSQSDFNSVQPWRQAVSWKM